MIAWARARDSEKPLMVRPCDLRQASRKGSMRKMSSRRDTSGSERNDEY